MDLAKTLNLQSCESEQLHLSGAIQAFGALIRIDAASARITHASENLVQFLGLDPFSIVGRSADVLTWLRPEIFRSLAERSGLRLMIRGVAERPSGRIDALVIRGTDGIVIELEKHLAVDDTIQVQQLQSFLSSAPGNATELHEYQRQLVRGVRIITGFDRVMIYRFLEDWSGEVIAEETVDGFGSYLGQRFPAGDIPAIARDLYMINPSRMIADVKATSVALLSEDGAPPDLTWSDLRSVSPLHVEYLSNMGVGASFSIPIRVSGRLWGLVACHHSEERWLSQDQRAASVVLSSLFSLGLSAYTSLDLMQAIGDLEQPVEAICDKLSHRDNPLDGVAGISLQLMALMRAQGLAVAAKDEVVIAGEGPDPEGMGIIDRWFLHKNLESIFVSDHLESIFSGQPILLALASGMLAFKFRSRRFGQIRFYWFRPSQLQEVVWAGNPNKSVEIGRGGAMLSPRRSFEKWIETRTGFSRPWSTIDIMAATMLYKYLLRLFK